MLKVRVVARCMSFVSCYARAAEFNFQIVTLTPICRFFSENLQLTEVIKVLFAVLIVFDVESNI